MKRKFIGFFMVAVVLMTFILTGCSATASKRSMGEVMDDAVITNKLKAKFIKDKVVKAFKLDIDTWKGIVHLKGNVTSQNQIDRAVEIAEQQPGVKEVKSYLLLTGSDDGHGSLNSPSSSSKPAAKRKTQNVEEVDLKPVSSKDNHQDSNFVDEDDRAHK